MAKTLKQMLEVYKPKSADEQKFVDKHVTVKHDDANGNKDDVFKGTNVKTIDRKKERHGYNPGDDEKVYEEVEQVNELKAGTLGSYAKKAGKDLRRQEDDMMDDQSWNSKSDSEQNKQVAKVNNREKGIKRATDKLTAKAMKNEEVSQVDEKLSPSQGAGEYVKDFEKSDAPQFKGKSKEKRRVMAIAAYMSAKGKNEEVEIDGDQIDEVSAKTLGSYIKKASSDAKGKGFDAGHQQGWAMAQSKELFGGVEAGQATDDKAHKRLANVRKATDKLVKKVNENVEHITEGEEAHAQFQKYHADTATLLKKIHQGLSKHYSAVTDKKGYNSGVAHWGHVGDIKHIHRQLQDIHDSILQQGEYAKPPQVKAMKEDVDAQESIDITLLNLYVNLDEDNRTSMLKMLDEGRKDELVEFAGTLESE